MVAVGEAVEAERVAVEKVVAEADADAESVAGGAGLVSPDENIVVDGNRN